MPGAYFSVLATGFVLAGGGAFISVTILTGVLRRLAFRYGLTDRPDHRKPHLTPTPYLGGVAIAMCSLVAAVIAVPVRDPRVLTLLGGGAVTAVLGLLDDVKSLGIVVRLATEGVAALAVAAAGVRCVSFAALPYLGRWPAIVVAGLWIVLVTNSFNLLDNSDGSAAGIALMTAPALTVLAVGAGLENVAVIQIALLCGCAGFLVHNWAPARVFMGDAGSLFLGFMMSASAILVAGSPDSDGGTSWMMRVAELLLLSFVALVDTGTVVLSRRRAKRPVLTGGTDHAAHRLRALGLGASQSAMLLSGSAGMSCACAVLVMMRALPAADALVGTLAVAVILIVLAQRVPVAAPGGMASRSPAAATRDAAAGLPPVLPSPALLEAAGEQDAPV